MKQGPFPSNKSRREVLRATGIAVETMAFTTLVGTVSTAGAADDKGLKAWAGVDRIAVLPGRTYLRGWAGSGDPPVPNRPRNRQPDGPAGATGETGPRASVEWQKVSGPGQVTFGDSKAAITTAAFSAPGVYRLKLTAKAGMETAESGLTVTVEPPEPLEQLDAVYTNTFKISSPLWRARSKALIVNWIPHCIEQINRTDLTHGAGGIDNFVEAGKALRGEPHGKHKGYVFSNAWVHQTVESMSIALMVDPQGDAEIIAAHEKMRKTLDDWIPKILSAQEPDGYLQTAFTLDRVEKQRGTSSTEEMKHWERRHDHEGYVAGYFIESAINHYLMTGKKDARLYDAARKLADCWYANIGPSPKKAWYDGHQEMEQALVRFGRFVNDMEGGGKGDKYVELAKFLLDSRYHAARSVREHLEYDQSYLPVTQQYEAVGHAVRAVYNYSAMADVAVETHDVDYQSAVKSLWDNIVNKKYYVTGGVGSGETAEGFGPNYSLKNNAYCEACSSCGAVFFQWKMHLATHESKYVDLYETTMYNALLGSTDLSGRNFYYDNPLDALSVRYPWHDCPCCVGNIPRTLLMLPTWTYSKNKDGVFVNLFVGSTITLENVAGTDVEMVQTTDYPWSGHVAIAVNPKAEKQFTVRIRVPNRSVSEIYSSTPDADGISSVRVNGAVMKPAIEKGYAHITRTWKAGDRIELVLPMRPQRIRPIQQVEVIRNRVALSYGPLIYNIERVDQDITKTIGGNSPLATEWRKDLLGGVMVIKGKFSDGSPLLAIPNYARMNREPEPAVRSPGTFQRHTNIPPSSIVWIRES